jgi:O-methyltransferase involved in polyketide biosynthesis
MYLDEDEVRGLLRRIGERFPSAELMFDAIPRWFSRKTLRGFYKTPAYRSPPMPWGIDRAEIESTLVRWLPRRTEVRLVPFGYLRGLAGVLLPIVSRIPGLRDFLPSIVRVTLQP